MNQEIKERWVAALRSGEYRQAKGYLRSREGFCCLGVLCDIAVADGVIEKLGSTDLSGVVLYGSPSYNMPEEYHSETALPAGVAEWAGLSDFNPEVYHPRDFHHPTFNDTRTRLENFFKTDLATLNDDEDLTFEEIADVIEEQL